MSQAGTKRLGHIPISYVESYSSGSVLRAAGSLVSSVAIMASELNDLMSSLTL